MLFDPEGEQGRRHITIYGGQAVNACVTGGTDGEKKILAVLSRAAVMHGLLIRSAADPAHVPVALKHGFAIIAKAAP